MQPPLDDQQVDHPAHPAGDPDGLAHVSWIDLCACKDLRHKDCEGDEHPDSEAHDRESQREAAQHRDDHRLATYYGSARRSTCHPAWCSQPAARTDACRKPSGRVNPSTCSGHSSQPVHPGLIPYRLCRLINAAVAAEDQVSVQATRELPIVGGGDHCALEGIEPLLQRLGGLQVEIVGRLVEEQQRRTAQLQQQNLEAGLLTSRQRLESLLS
jgi:hypothetical protein